MRRELLQRPEAPWRGFIAGFIRCGSPLLAVLTFRTLFDFRPGLIAQDFLVAGAISLGAGVIGGIIFAVPSIIRLWAYKYLGGR